MTASRMQLRRNYYMISIQNYWSMNNANKPKLTYRTIYLGFPSFRWLFDTASTRWGFCLLTSDHRWICCTCWHYYLFHLWGYCGGCSRTPLGFRRLRNLGRHCLIWLKHIYNVLLVYLFLYCRQCLQVHTVLVTLLSLSLWIDNLHPDRYPGLFHTLPRHHRLQITIITISPDLMMHARGLMDRTKWRR